ncbi:MAG: hypothetical protein KGM42_06540 [Hyphomicrobiales bacterium]|nr:hypothetical protein [Hyphomicrobiales bacterium]
MATIERALNAHSLYWIKDETGDRIGIVWGLDGVWRWSVGSAESKPAASFEEARQLAETALGKPLLAKAKPADKARHARAA